MKGRQPPETPIDGKALWTPVDGKAQWKPSPMDAMWAEAAREFEKICGKSLSRGDVRGFDDVQKKIETSNKPSYGTEPTEDDKWKKAKDVGLQSLKFLKLLVGAASQASSFIPVPGAVATVTTTALGFVFDIPEAIKGYEDAVDQVFSEVSSALSQFRIYSSMEEINADLIKQIHLVMVSFVKLCAHVVKYRQGGKWARFVQKAKSVFDDDSGLSDEMTEFKRLLQQQRDVEGTLTLAVVVESRRDIVAVLEKSALLIKTTEETKQIASETQKGVQSLKDDADRTKTLIKIRDTLGLPPMVRLDAMTTQTCTNISERCLGGSGSWIWTHEHYQGWIAHSKGRDFPHILVVSGPPSSGKTSASALITKRLEEQKNRTYVAHYFFPASTKKSDDENSVPGALKYMAFQIARSDGTVLKALGKACEAGPGLFRRPANIESLDSLWDELKIGAPGSGAIYYLVFDGIENLPPKQAEVLLKFVFSPKLSGESTGRVRVLVSGSDDLLERPGVPRIDGAWRIRMETENTDDMRLYIDEALAKRGMLQHTKPDSDQRKARDKIREKLPKNVKGSYSLLQFGLDDVMRLLSTRTAAQELDKVLGQTISSHETAIKNLQRSLSVDEINDLNEILKWVLFGYDSGCTLGNLEEAMFLYSGTESLVTLEYIIENKYSAVLKIEDGIVLCRDGVRDFLEREKANSAKTAQSKDRATISMTITINNVDQEMVGHFLWDLAHKAIRDKFKFDFDAGSPNSTLQGRQAAITVDAFEAHHTIVMRAFAYLDQEPRDQTKGIGIYLCGLLPFHLSSLRRLEEDDRELAPSEQSEIGQSLQTLFKDQQVFERHKASFQATYWFTAEMEDVQKWLMDSAVMRRVNREWRQTVQQPVSPTRGFMKPLLEMIIRGFLRARTWPVRNAYNWIAECMRLDEKKLQPAPEKTEENEANPPSPTPPGPVINDEIDWDRVSSWCQGFLRIPDSELDSLWYERLAEAAVDTLGSTPEAALTLYRRALEKDNPSWICHRGMAEAFFRQDSRDEASAQIELALAAAERDDATPKPEAKDFVDLRMRLGQYSFANGDMEKSAELYLQCIESEDAEQAKKAQVGYLKARLRFPDEDGTRDYLRSLLPSEGSDGKMIDLLRLMALEYDHDTLVFKLFGVASKDAALLKDIVLAMETASSAPEPDGDRSTDALNDDELNDESIRGVLLFDRGLAAYAYKVVPDDTIEPVGEALRLWRESYDKLDKVGGPNAYIIKRDAKAALSRHYFQKMVEGNHLDHVDKLATLAEGDDNIFLPGEPAGYLSAIYALRGEKEQAKAALRKRVRQSLQFLSDDLSYNDGFGVSALSGALLQSQDFEGAAVAISLLGTPDIIIQALKINEDEVVPDEGESKLQLLDSITQLRRDIIQIMEDKVPDITQQAERIQAAKEYLESLMATPQPQSETAQTDAPPNSEQVENKKAPEDQPKEGNVPAADDQPKNGNQQKGDEQPEGHEPPQDDNHPKEDDQLKEIAHARRIVHERIRSCDADDREWHFNCCRLLADGTPCGTSLDFHRGFYICVFCATANFCGECLPSFRALKAGELDTMRCDAKHRWLHIPPYGDAMYLGLKSRTVRLPKEVKPSEEDDKILEIVWGDEPRVIFTETWKEVVAKEWDISIEEIKTELSKQNLDENQSEDEKEL